MSDLISKVEVEVIAMGNGWQTIALTFDDTKVGFLASYVGECPLSSLITVVAGIDVDIVDDVVPIKRHREWFQEPGAMQFAIESDGLIDQITIKQTSRDMLGFDFDVEEMENPEKVYHFQVKHEALRNAVIAEATRMLKLFGIRGYNDNWNDGLDNFPVAAYLQLLGHKVDFDEESDSYSSSLQDEIDVLKSIL